MVIEAVDFEQGSTMTCEKETKKVLFELLCRNVARDDSDTVEECNFCARYTKM